MIHAIELENFKGIASRQRVDFAPLTLLFGANSAGKSTILQALLYLHELLERGSADVDRTELGGNVLELGGFARLVHRHETERAIVLRAEFATPGGLERFGRDLADFPFPNLDDDVESAWLELTIRFRTSPTFRGPLVERAVIGVNGETEPLVWIEVGAALREGEPLHARVNLGHPLLATETRELTDAVMIDDDGKRHPVMARHAPAEVTEAWEAISIHHGRAVGGRDERAVGGRNERAVVGSPDVEEPGSRSRAKSGAKSRSVSRSGSGAKTRSYSGSGAGTGAGSGLEDGAGFGDGRALPVFALSRSRLSALPTAIEPLVVIDSGDTEDLREELRRLEREPTSERNRHRIESLVATIAERAGALAHVRTFFEMVVLGTTGQLVSFLRDAIYIGPLRTIPPRGFLYERAGRITSWADGLAAWDLLLADRVSLVERTNRWLRRLEVGCQIVVQQLFEGTADAEELSAAHVDKTVRRLLLDTGGGSFVLPSEVGAGVSQILPVVVAALDGRYGVSLFEQPEIHVHPAVQVRLGDLLIDAVTRESGRRTLLIETHSEHLILRLLRRIRETTEKELPAGAPPFAEDKLSVLYIESGPDGVRVRRLHVDERGEFTDRWPRGFFEERAEELF